MYIAIVLILTQMFVFVSENNIPMGMLPLTSAKTIGKYMQGTHLDTNGGVSCFLCVFHTALTTSMTSVSRETAFYESLS